MRKRIIYQLVTTSFVLLTLLLSSAVNLSAQDLKSEIVSALERGDTTLAIDLLNKEISFDKSYYLNYYTLGMIYFERYQYAEALEQFKLSTEKKKKDFESLYYLGLSYIELNDTVNAEKVMSEGIKKDKKEKHRFEDGLGLVRMIQGKNAATPADAKLKYKEADKLFRSALVSHAANADYHIHLGDANFYQGVPSLAIIEYEKALKVDTAGLEVYYHWAEACLEMKDYNCAIEKLKVVLQKDSTHAPAWMRAAGIYYKAARSSRVREERTNRFKETIGAYKKYLELADAKADSSTVRVFFEMGMSYSALNGYEDAAEYFEKVLSIPMEPKDIYFNYGKALWGTKQYAKSGEMLNKHLEWAANQNGDYKSNIREFELYQLLGDSYYYRESKDFFAAIESYKKSIEARPEQKRLVQNIAVAYYNLKSYEQALEYYQKRIEFGIDAKYASVYKYAGYCALNIANNSSGDDDEEEMEEDVAPAADVNYYQLVVDMLNKYMEFDSSDVKIMSLIASTSLFQLQDCENGVKYFDKVIEMDPGNCDALKSLGYAYFGGSCTMNYSKALNYLKKADKCINAAGAGGDAEITMLIAKAYHLRAAAKANKKEDANDDFKNAFNWYGKVLKYQPNNTEAKKGQDDTRFEFVE